MGSTGNDISLDGRTETRSRMGGRGGLRRNTMLESSRGEQQSEYILGARLLGSLVSLVARLVHQIMHGTQHQRPTSQRAIRPSKAPGLASTRAPPRAIQNRAHTHTHLLLPSHSQYHRSRRTGSGIELHDAGAGREGRAGRSATHEWATTHRPRNYLLGGACHEGDGGGERRCGQVCACVCVCVCVRRSRQAAIRISALLRGIARSGKCSLRSFSRRAAALPRRIPSRPRDNAYFICKSNARAGLITTPGERLWVSSVIVPRPSLSFLGEGGSPCQPRTFGADAADGLVGSAMR